MEGERTPFLFVDTEMGGSVLSCGHHLSGMRTSLNVKANTLWMEAQKDGRAWLWRNINNDN